jgi:hypothetical protein
MNRCTLGFLPSSFASVLAAALVVVGVAMAALASAPAHAQVDSNGTVIPNVRQFPKTAVRGELLIKAAPDAYVDGKPDRLSPAVRIRDINNNVVLSGTLTEQKLVVNYMRDNTGLVNHVWILNSEEIKQKMPGQDAGFLSNIRSAFDTPKPVDDGKTPYNKLPRYGE